MSKLQLYIKGMTGETVTISCLDDIIVRDLKCLIAKKINIEHYFKLVIIYN